MSSSNRDNFTFFFKISFSCLIVLVRTSSTMFNRNGENDHPGLVLDCGRRAFCFSSLSMMLAVGLSYMAFIVLRYISSIPNVRVFIIKGLWILSNDFSASLKIIVGFLSFILLIWCITLTDLHMLGHSCITGSNLTWYTMVYNPFNMLLNSVW